MFSYIMRDMWLYSCSILLMVKEETLTSVSFSSTDLFIYLPFSRNCITLLKNEEGGRHGEQDMSNNDSIDSVYHRESMVNWFWSVEEEEVNYLNGSGYSDYFDLTWGGYASIS